MSLQPLSEVAPVDSLLLLIVPIECAEGLEQTRALENHPNDLTNPGKSHHNRKGGLGHHARWEHDFPKDRVHKGALSTVGGADHHNAEFLGNLKR